jgi:hypothetical protein
LKIDVAYRREGLWRTVRTRPGSIQLGIFVLDRVARDFSRAADKMLQDGVQGSRPAGILSRALSRRLCLSAAVEILKAVQDP